MDHPSQSGRLDARASPREGSFPLRVVCAVLCAAGPALAWQSSASWSLVEDRVAQHRRPALGETRFELQLLAREGLLVIDEELPSGARRITVPLGLLDPTKIEVRAVPVTEPDAGTRTVYGLRVESRGGKRCIELRTPARDYRFRDKYLFYLYDPEAAKEVREALEKLAGSFADD